MGIPTPPQVMGWPVIGAGKSALIVAPTGSGKTLAAFLAGIDWLARSLLTEERDEGGGALVGEHATGHRNRGRKHGTQAGTLPSGQWGVQILYVSPLKSLANDVQKNLLKPLEELAEIAAAGGLEWPAIRVAVRTGDTPQKGRAAIARRPPHILITTPESLNLMLMTGARGVLSTVRYVIVDEVHALAGSKRGVFLSLVLERLEEERRGSDEGQMINDKKGSRRAVKIAPGVYVQSEPVGDLVRIGLSATVHPEEEIGRWLAGCDDRGKPRPMEIIRTGQRKRLDLGVVCPFAIGAEEALEAREKERAGGNGEPRVKGTGHWPEVTRAILQMIREHRSTLVFGNSRRLIERLAARFEEELEGERDAGMLPAAGESSGKGQIHARGRKHGTQGEAPRIPVILPHHGSIAKEVRLETEQALKRGEVDAVLATSSLELGIDIGSLDLVVQIDSPGNVAAGLQRVGRAGHLEKATAKGRFVARGSFELGGFAALLPLMFEGKVEETRVPVNCLDVLAQQVVAACVVRPWKRERLHRMFKRAMPYRGLTEKQFESVVGMLSKRAQRVTAQGLRPRISFDRVNDELVIMPGAAKVVLVNSGVIADTGQYPVYLIGAKRGKVELAEEKAPREAAQERWGMKKEPPGVRLGELDEEFVYETKEGDRIVLGSQTWRVVRIDADRVLVERAEPGSSRMPFWRGESAPRSEMLGEALARFYGEMERRMENRELKTGKNGEEDIGAWLMRERQFDPQAAENAVVFFGRQMDRGAIPTERQIVVEHFIDRAGEPIIAIISPFGSRVNYARRLALEGQFARRRLPAQLVHSDDGIIIRPPVETGEIPQNPLAWLRSRTLEQEIVDQLEGTSLFGLRFRQNAARALMLPKMTLSQRTPLWQQRLRARHLLALVKKERNFPIIVETYRECLQDVLNIPKVAEILEKVESGGMAVRIVRQHEPGEASPFARSLFSQFQQTYLYAWDDPLLPVELEPAVDQHILDEILQRRGDGSTERREEETRAWKKEDEETLRRRIWGLDYPARSAEELLEKIEAAGAVGVELGMTDDPGWREWVVDENDAPRMLAELSGKRRLLRINWGKKSGGGGGAEDFRWIATENLALLLAARDGEEVKFYRLAAEGKKMAPVGYDELPAALLETPLTGEEARRLVVEQALRREPLTDVETVAGRIPWMKEAVKWIEVFNREGLVVGFADGKLAWGEYAEQLRAMALRRERRAAATVDLAALQRHLLHWQHVRGALEQAAPPEESGMATVDAVEDVLDLFTGLTFPLEVWEHEILPVRVEGFAPAILDGICRGGHRVWVGRPEGMAFWPRHLLGQRPARDEAMEISPTSRKVLEHLQTHGASFQFDMQQALGMDEGEMALALHELAFAAGLVSSDQLEGLREVERLAEVARRDRSRGLALPRLHATHPRHVPRPARMPRNWWRQNHGVTAGNLGGRWYLLPPVAPPSTALDRAQQAADRVERLLRRTGFACRELAEPQVDGPWKGAYDVLTRMEWAGTVRRGYFVDGIAGSQFAHPAARLEAQSGEGGVVWLSMIDPANIWARASTRWISDSGPAARVPRIAGSWIALVDGRPVVAAVAWGQRLIPLPAAWEQQERALLAVGELLNRLPRDSHPYLAVREWDQRDILGSPAEELLRRQGFTRDTQGLRLYRQYAIV